MTSSPTDRIDRRALLRLGAAATGALALPASLRAQSAWPSKAIRFVVPFAPGGSSEIIARATAELMGRYPACVWAQHGLFCSGADFDATFGLMHTVEKAAAVYAQARLLNGGSDAFPNTIPDAGLRAIAETYHLPINGEFLEG